MMQAISSQIRKSQNQIRQAFKGIVARGGSQSLQLTGVADEILQEVELIQNIGFSSHIPENAQVVIIPLGGKTSRSIVVATTGGNVVVNVGAGETCIYDQFGHSILLHQNGIKMVGNTEIDGELLVKKGIKSDADISDKIGSMAQMRVVYDGHLHGNSPPPNQKME